MLPMLTYQNPYHINRIFRAVCNDIFGTCIHFTFLMQFMDTITLVDPEVCDVIRQGWVETTAALVCCSAYQILTAVHALPVTRGLTALNYLRTTIMTS